MPFQQVDESTGEELLKLADHHIHTISLWLRKMGKDTNERKAFWMAVAEAETDELDYVAVVRKTPPTPATIVFESGEGLGHRPGLVQWNRPYPIDLEVGHFPYDFPLNNKQVADFGQAGYRLSLLPDGTGFRYTTLSSNGNRPNATRTLEVMEQVFHLLLTEKEQETKHEQRETAETRDIGLTHIRSENVGAGRAVNESCPT